jgi:hypothetical protein
MLFEPPVRLCAWSTQRDTRFASAGFPDGLGHTLQIVREDSLLSMHPARRDTTYRHTATKQ